MSSDQDRDGGGCSCGFLGPRGGSARESSPLSAWLEKLVFVQCAQMSSATSPWQSAEVLITNEKFNAQDAVASLRSRYSMDTDTSREHRLQPELLNSGSRRGEPEQLETSTASPAGNRLYWWDEVPNVLQFNKYVRSGYRADLSRRQCICSILQLHNETGNIHSHLLPALLLVALLATEAIPVWPKAKFAFIDSVIPSLLCLSGSVCYHTLMPDHRNYKRYLMIDMCGVFLVLVCGAGSGIYWGLQCYPSLRTFFLAAYYLSAVACVIAGLAAKTQMGRAIPMLGLLGVRGFSLATRILLRTGSQTAAYHYLAMEATGLAGALINLLRVPEKWLFPRGNPLPTCRKASFFDYWLNSHQLMHILVVLAMIFKYLGTSADYRYRVEEGVGC